MCGRFVLSADQVTIESHYNVALPDSFQPRASIAPSQKAPVVIRQNGASKAVFAGWGLIPGWAKDAAIAKRTFNARAETVDEKPSFRQSFLTGRCLVPATGFIEWQKLEDGTKRPYLIKLASADLFSFAGLWSLWVDRATGLAVPTFTIITTQPNELVAKLHDRMPAMLGKEDEGDWLDRPDKSLLKPFDGSLMEATAWTAASKQLF